MHATLRYWKQHHRHIVPLHRSSRSRATLSGPGLDWILSQTDQGCADCNAFLLPCADLCHRFELHLVCLPDFLLLQRETAALLRASRPQDALLRQPELLIRVHSALHGR